MTVKACRSSRCRKTKRPGISRFVNALCWWLVVGLWCLAVEAGAQPQARKAQQADASRRPGRASSEAEQGEALHEVEEHVEEAAVKAGKKFSAYLEEFFGRLPRGRRVRVALLAVALVCGCAFLFFGWSLLKAFFVPVAAASGCIAGGFLGYNVMAALSPSTGVGLLLAAGGAGMIAGAVLLLFTATNARPLAALLFVLTPFVILSCVLFPFDAKLGLAAFGGGVVLGAVSMMKLRPMAIAGSSVLGAVAFMVAWRLLADFRFIGFAGRSLAWLTARPVMLLVVLGMIAVVGVSTQSTMAPGELESEEPARPGR